MIQQNDPDMVKKRNRRTLWTCASVVVGMVGLSYASVPLYQLFCQVTGFGGTTMVAESAPVEISDKTIRIRFNADINGQLPWKFAPEQREMTVRLGEDNLAFYVAENLTNAAITGHAIYNVTPLKAGQYFNKIACFCFDEQTLEAGQTVDMPVSFFVDPAIAEDLNTQDVKTITLSYTFYRSDNAVEAKTGDDGQGG